MKIHLDCPYAYHGDKMRLFCKANNNELCVWQYYKSCKGWWVNCPEAAAGCLIRKEQNANSDCNTMHGEHSDNNG